MAEATLGLGGEGPKMVVSMLEAREVAVVGVGGSEFSLTMEQGDVGEEAVVFVVGALRLGSGIAFAVTGVVELKDTAGTAGDCAADGRVLDRFGGRGRWAMGPWYVSLALSARLLWAM